MYPKVKGYMINCFDPRAYVDDDGTIYVACGVGSTNTDAEPMISAIIEPDDVNSTTVGIVDFKTAKFTNIINTVGNITGTHDATSCSAETAGSSTVGSL